MRQAWRRSRAGLAVVLLLTAFINLMKLTIPLYIFQLLDRVIASRSVDTLVLLTAITIFAVLVASLAELTRRWMLAHWGTWIEQHFGKQLFAGSLTGQRMKSPTKALEELSEVSQFVSGSGATTWLDVVWAPAFLLIVLLIHPLLAAIVLAGMLLMLALGILNEVATRTMRAESRRARRRSERWITTAERHLDTVASLNIGERLAERWYKSSASRMGESFSTRMTGASIGEAMRFVEALQRVACYGIGVWLAVSDQLTVGGIIAAAVLGRLGTSSVRRAMSNWRQLVLVWRSYHRMERRLTAMRDTEKAVRDPDAALSLQLEQVTHTHNSVSRPLFQEINLEVQPGEILCIVGPSGSGKTTLAKLIAGVISPTMGHVRLGGLDIARFTSAERQRLLGYLQQDTTLLDGTIAENIASLRNRDERQLVEAAKLAGIHDVITHLPEGYETPVRGARSMLAGGEIRRLGAARALFGRPKLIVLDEPEANLDEQLIEHLMGSLVECKRWGSVVVITSQMPRLTEIADKVLVLDKTVGAQIISGAAFTSGWQRAAAPSPEDYNPHWNGVMS